MPALNYGIGAIKGQGVTISSGSITVSSGSLVEISAEGGTTDTLDTILLDSTLAAEIPANYYPIIWIKAATGHTITLTNDWAALSVNQMAFGAGSDVTLTDTQAMPLLRYGGTWLDMMAATRVAGGFAGLNSPALITPTFTGLETAEGVYKAANVNGLATGQTVVVPVRTGKRFIPTRVVVELVSVSGAGTVPSLRVGNNGSFDNAVSTTALTNLDTQYETLNLSLISPLSSIDVNANGISVDVQTAATGYSTYTMNVYVSGYYR